MTRNRIYLVLGTHEPTDLDAYSSLKKLVEQIDTDLTYRAIAHRLRRAKERTGRALIRIKDRKGKLITLEIKDVE